MLTVFAFVLRYLSSSLRYALNYSVQMIFHWFDHIIIHLIGGEWSLSAAMYLTYFHRGVLMSCLYILETIQSCDWEGTVPYPRTIHWGLPEHILCTLTGWSQLIQSQEWLPHKKSSKRDRQVASGRMGPSVFYRKKLASWLSKMEHNDKFLPR